MTVTRLVLAVLLAVSTASAAFAQGNPTGTISGRVLSDAGPLPGVTVTATSPNLQGARSAVTSDNGDYILPLLPPGDYTLSFELQGFRTVQQTSSVAVGQTVPLNVSMLVAAASETVQVTGQVERFAQTAPVTTTMRATEIASLPSDRSLAATMLFAPGVFNTGPSTNAQDSAATAITISGAMTFENLFMVNGVVINENIRGQGVPLVIEDAVQETTVSTGAISAEFGRFSGGVVNAVTKSGGNRFSGSFRTSLQNDSWRALTPQAGDVKVDDTVPTYEFTGGGPIAKDHLWFFGAGRIVDLVLSRQTTTTNIPYAFTDKERRYEGKLTYSANPNHTVRGAYLYRNRDQLNQNSFNVMDLQSLYNRSLPENLTSFNYTGVLSTNFFLESTVSRRRQTFVGSGATSTDIIDGTLVTDQARGTRFWAPTFCAVCGPDEERNNDNVVVKGTYFLSTGTTGSHNLVFGYDTFNDIRIAENHQSGSDYRILGTTSILRNGVVYPSWTNSTIIQWNPIDASSLGTDFRTHSLFFNDQWRLSDRVTINLGVRWDKNSGKDSADQTVADDSAFAPRLAVTWDPAGTGLWTVNAGYGRYVAGLANGIADSGSNGGVPATYQYAYLGPTINTDANAATLVPTDVALATLWSWFNANGGTNRPTVGVDIPGISRRIGDNLRSPSTDEFSVGVSRQLGGRGMVRLDAIYRSWGDFYYSQRDTTTGTVVDPAGIARDLTIDGNSNDPERKYAALNAQATWRFGTRLNINGSYTLSRTYGTFDGETLNNGPVTAGLISAGSATNGRAGWGVYPEYVVADWNRPEGDLGTDQRHRARLWAVYQIPLSERWGSLSLSAIEQMNSGSPYFAAGPVNPTTYVVVPSYQTPPTQVAYFFTDRDGFRTDNVFRTDVALNYNYRLKGSAELFFQTQVWNLFNADDIADVNNIDVTTRTRDGGATNLVRFNPFTETPVQGTHWEPGPNFGTARNKNAYQLPRQIRFSFGIRF